MTVEVQLKDRDFVLAIDASGSMGTADQAGGKTRWEAAAEATVALANKAVKYDPDGLTVYTFNSRFRMFDNVASSAKVAQIFEEVEPNSSTNLDGVLKDIFNTYLSQKNSQKTKPNGTIALVITDGQPDDPAAVKRSIIDFTQKLDKDEEFGILFVQVGNDQGARAYLKTLDDDLKGAKFDIVDTLTIDEMGDRSLNDVLAGAIAD